MKYKGHSVNVFSEYSSWRLILNQLGAGMLLSKGNYFHFDSSKQAEHICKSKGISPNLFNKRRKHSLLT